jgi:uncharacterized protein with GYD domain
VNLCVRVARHPGANSIDGDQQVFSSLAAAQIAVQVKKRSYPGLLPLFPVGLDKLVQPEYAVDGLQTKKRLVVMATYIALLQYTDQGIRNVKDTTKRAAAASDAAAKLGVKFTDLFWTLGQYDLAILAEAPDDETMTAVMLKIASLGNVKSQTLRAFRPQEMETLLKKTA